MRRVGLFLSVGLMLSVVSWSSVVSARKTGPEDYFLDPPAAGLWAHLDAITIGAQASLEHRLEVDGDITMLVTRLSALASLGYAETAAHADFRVALFTVGGSVGYRRGWRNYSLPNDVDNTAKIRREMDKGESPFERNVVNWPWAEGRIRAVIPLETLWLVTNAALRHESGPGNAFDWFHTNVHDGGLLWRADATLFVRHEDYGAIGSALRYMRYPKKGQQVDELAYGFTLGTRPGWRRKMDLFLFQFLTVPTSDEFGFHVLRVPFYTMLIYRASFGLSLPPDPYLGNLPPHGAQPPLAGSATALQEGIFLAEHS